MEKMEIDIMGNKWTITIKDYDDDDYFETMGVGGYCEMPLHNIVVCDMSTYPGYAFESAKFTSGQTKEIMRHEIVHAYLYESGMNSSSHSTDSWALDEEIIDWIALQFPKMCRTFKTLNIL